MTPVGNVERVWMDERRSIAVDEIGTGKYFGIFKLGIESSIPLSLNKYANFFQGQSLLYLQAQRKTLLLQHQSHQGQWQVFEKHSPI